MSPPTAAAGWDATLRREITAYTLRTASTDDSVVARGWLLCFAQVFLQKSSQSAEMCALIDQLHDKYDLSDIVGDEAEDEMEEGVFGAILAAARAMKSPNGDSTTPASTKMLGFSRQRTRDDEEYNSVATTSFSSSSTTS